MSRTIADLTAGTLLYIDETISGAVVHTPYIYLGLDDGGKARVLRQYAAVQRRMNATNVASYDGCEADLWLNNTETGFLSRFDAATLDALVNTEIKYVDYNQSGDGTAQMLSIARRCFLMGYTEEGYGNIAGGQDGKSYLSALETFTGKTGNNARITYNEAGNAVSAWMRSAVSVTNFWYVVASGSASYYYASYGGSWLRPALSVAPATSVSDEGADAIFLLPEGRKTFWGIDAVISLGTTATRPKKAKLQLPHDYFTVLNVEVCNNLDDETPTWITSGDGQVTTFGDTKTADAWKLGVKIHAEAPGPDHTIGEPSMIVEMEAAE